MNKYKLQKLNILLIAVVVILLDMPMIFWSAHLGSKIQGKQMQKRYVGLQRTAPVPEGYMVPQTIGTDPCIALSLDDKVYISVWNVFDQANLVPADDIAYSMTEDARFRVISTLQGVDSDKMLTSYIDDRSIVGDPYNEALVFLEYDYFLETEGVI